MTDDNDEDTASSYTPPLPQQWEYTKTFYKAMWDEAVPEIVQGMECRRFKGGLRQFLLETCGSGAHYGKIINNNLQGMGCIEMQKKGGGRGAPTEVLLIMDPETALQNPVAVRKARRLSDTSSVQGQLRVIFRRLDDMQRELVRHEREIKYLKGERPREDYVPSPNLKAQTAELQKLVGFAEKLGVDLDEEESG